MSEAVKRWSPQQSAVIDWVKHGTGSAFVEAVAGAGKTTTLIGALRETRGTVDFTAYNKKIADEIKAKVAKLDLGKRVQVGTFHSFGFAAWRKVYPKVKAGPDAATEKADRTARHLEIPVAVRSLVEKLVSLAKQRGMGLIGSIDDRSLYYAIVDHFDLAYEVEDPKHIEIGIDLAIRALHFHQGIAHEIIDFDDMIWLPVITGVKVWQNDWVLVDEAQDTNPSRRALARKMLMPNGRAMFVGDRAQAIYGFTGADNDAIEQIIRDFHCVTLPLTTTFRCPKAVVEKAREIVSHIEAHETAPDGMVHEMDETTLIQIAEHGGDLAYAGLHPTDDAILCRNTKPLVSLAYQLIRRGVACHVEGRDIGAGLIKLANRWWVRDLDELRERLEAFGEREIEKLIAKGRETQAEALHDKIDTLYVIMEQCQTLDQLRQKIVDLFMDGEHEAKPTLTLSTVHKAKGREWPRVFVLGKNAYMPSKYARQAWQLQQESHLIYVAYTRAMEELVLVNVPVA